MTDIPESTAARMQLEDDVGEALIAVGLYTACFEAMTFGFREKMRTYIDLHDRKSRAAFERACEGADRTAQFCGPRLVARGVLAADDLTAIVRIRRRRNEYAHEGFRRIRQVKLAEMDADLDAMYDIARRVQYWTIESSAETRAGFPPGVNVSFVVEPTLLTNLVREIASTIVATRFRRVGEGQGQ